MSKEQLLEEVLSLSEEDREFLAEGLLLSINHTSTEEIDSLWKTEAANRLDRTNNGELSTFDGKEIINTLRSSLRQ